MKGEEEKVYRNIICYFKKIRLNEKGLKKKED